MEINSNERERRKLARPILSNNDKFLLLLANLEGLKIVDISFVEYRSKVFESISLLRELRYGTKESNEAI